MTTHEVGEGITVHTHACGEGGIFVNAYVVETRRGLVAIDSTLTESESQSFRREIDALDKPLLAILITHPHPDHVAGITNLVGNGGTKIIATRPVLELMRKLEEPKRKQWTPVFGSEWIQRWTYPDTIVTSGDSLTFDGLTYSVLDVGPGAIPRRTPSGSSKDRTAPHSSAIWCSTVPTRMSPTATCSPGSRTSRGSNARARA